MGITISTVDCPTELKNKLKKSVGIKYIVDTDKSKDFTIFEINFDKDMPYGGYENLSEIIADIVVETLEEKLVKKIVNHRYRQFSQEEGENIVDSALKIMNSSLLQTKVLRKKKIIKELINYMEKNKDLNLEGFVRFRLKEYMKHLNLAIEQAADELMIEKEYNDFIELLRYFVDLQEEQIDLVHVKKTSDESYEIYDKDHYQIKDKNIENYIKELIEEEITYEDLLISALINISPAKIILHFEDEEVVETVQKIFTRRVDICEGCNFCQRE